MRRLVTTEELHQRGLTRAEIRWALRTGRWHRVVRGLYLEGPDPPSSFERAVASVRVADGVASGTMAGALARLDSVPFTRVDFSLEPGASGRRQGVRRRHVDPARIVVRHGIKCVDGTQTMLDLAAELDDLAWEQALESALRKELTTIAVIEAAIAAKPIRGAARIRRVLALRPPGAPPTGSLLETLMVQLIRSIPGIPEPVRQYVVYNEHGDFVARIDLCWPELGLFIELDGQHHRGQPVYDATRETAIVAVTGWLCGRFTWDNVVVHAAVARRRVAALHERARQRPVTM